MFKSSQKDLFLALILFAACLVLYTKTLLPGVGYSDIGELQTVAFVLGIAHPSGYPLYTLLGKIFTFLPFNSVAWRLNFMSAFFAAFSVALMFYLVRILTGNRIAAVTAASLFAVSPNFWRHALVAEMYSLNLFFVVLLLILLFFWQENKNSKLLYLFSFFFGLSWGNHTGIIVLTPAFLMFILTQNRFNRKAMSRYAFTFLLFLLALLGIYLYLPLRSFQKPSLEYIQINSLETFFLHVTAREFRSLMFAVPLNQFLERLLVFSQLARKQFTLLGIILASLGIVAMAKKQPRRLSLLLGIFILTVIVWLEYRVPDFDRYITPAFLIIGATVGVGIDRIEELLRDTLARSKLVSRKFVYKITTLVIIVVMTLLALRQLSTHYSKLDQSNNFAAEEFAESVVATIEPHSVLISWWGYSTVLWYEKYVEKRLPDIEVINCSQQEWLGQVEKFIKLKPVYLVEDNENIREKYQLVKQGRLYKVLPYPTNPPSRIY